MSKTRNLKVLDDELLQAFIGKEVENEVTIHNNMLSEIGDLKGDYNSLRKLDVAFNEFKSLRGIDKFPRLRHLSVYCCRLEDIEDIENTTQLVHLMAQQNGLTAIPRALQSLKHLRELRLDRNQLTSIGNNLSACTSLRVLDLSGNKIEDLTGLSGLHSLRELRLNNNKITSIKPLKALPVLMELQVSNNRLTTLDGIQQLPTLEIIYAENNELTTLKIPQTYFKQVAARNAEDTKDGKAATGVVVGKQNVNARRAFKASTGGGNNSHRTQFDRETPELVTILGMQNLTDVFVANNQIESLDGLGSLGVSIEVFDLSNNRIDLRAITTVVEPLSTLTNLTEVNLKGNVAPRLTPSEEFSEQLAKALLSVCPSVRVVDGEVHRESKKSGSSKKGLQLAQEEKTSEDGQVSSGRRKIEEEKSEGKEGDQITAVMTGSSGGGGSGSEEVQGESSMMTVTTGMGAETEEYDSDYEKELKIRKLFEEHTAKTAEVLSKNAPLTNEEILKIEGSFQSLLSGCKGQLKSLLSLAGTLGLDDDNDDDEAKENNNNKAGPGKGAKKKDHDNDSNFNSVSKIIRFASKRGSFLDANKTASFIASNKKKGKGTSLRASMNLGQQSPGQLLGVGVGVGQQATPSGPPTQDTLASHGSSSGVALVDPAGATFVSELAGLSSYEQAFVREQLKKNLRPTSAFAKRSQQQKQQQYQDKQEKEQDPRSGASSMIHSQSQMMPQPPVLSEADTELSRMLQRAMSTNSSGLNRSTAGDNSNSSSSNERKELKTFRVPDSVKRLMANPKESVDLEGSVLMSKAPR